MTSPDYLPMPDDPDPTCALCFKRAEADDWSGTLGEFFCPACLESLLGAAKLMEMNP